MLRITFISTTIHNESSKVRLMTSTIKNILYIFTLFLFVHQGLFYGVAAESQKTEKKIVAELEEVKSIINKKNNEHKVKGSKIKNFTLNINKAGFIGYSFTLNKKVTQRDKTDIILYFDNDDCRKGAIFGNEDDKGFIFPLGKKTWSELKNLTHSKNNSTSIVGILPITKDKVGYAFWLKTIKNKFVLVRIKSVQESTTKKINNGKEVKVEFEWMWKP